MNIKEVNELLIEMGKEKRKKLNYHRLYWTKEDEDFLKRNYLFLPTDEIAKRLGRTNNSIHKMAKLLKATQKRRIRK